VRRPIASRTRSPRARLAKAASHRSHCLAFAVEALESAARHRRSTDPRPSRPRGARSACRTACPVADVVLADHALAAKLQRAPPRHHDDRACAGARRASPSPGSAPSNRPHGLRLLVRRGMPRRTFGLRQLPPRAARKACETWMCDEARPAISRRSTMSVPSKAATMRSASSRGLAPMRFGGPIAPLAW